MFTYRLTSYPTPHCVYYVTLQSCPRSFWENLLACLWCFAINPVKNKQPLYCICKKLWGKGSIVVWELGRRWRRGAGALARLGVCEGQTAGPLNLVTRPWPAVSAVLSWCSRGTLCSGHDIWVLHPLQAVRCEGSDRWWSWKKKNIWEDWAPHLFRSHDSLRSSLRKWFYPVVCQDLSIVGIQCYRQRREVSDAIKVPGSDCVVIAAYKSSPDPAELIWPHC